VLRLVPHVSFLCRLIIHTYLAAYIRRYGGPGKKSPDYSAFGQITGLCPCQLQTPNATRLEGQHAVQGVIPIFLVGLSVYALF
jgi:hypothetical protein